MVVQQRSKRFPVGLLLLTVAGLLAAGLGLVMVIGGFVRAVASPDEFATPGEATLRLEPGAHLVYQRTATQGSFGAENDGAVALTLEQVAVTDPAGNQLPLELPNVTQTITRGSAVFTGAVQFEVKTEGQHRVEVRTDAGNVLVSRSLGSTFRQAVPWILLIVGGGLLALVSGIATIVSLVRRRRDSPAPAAAAPASGMAQPAAPAPGWYPDPSGSGGTRYWDGRAWTEHRA